MPALWDTTGTEVVRDLAAERRTAGGVASGLALTLVVVTDEWRVHAVEDAATIAAAEHPCRLLVAVRDARLDGPSRLDAEIIVGGRLGPCEAVVMRMGGRLALHAESVVMPLLAPDAPVVTWWHCAPPDRIAYDPLGVVAERRVTDVVECPDPISALRERGDDYAPGDTDLSWTRITPWRTLLAGVFDTVESAATSIEVTAPPDDPGAALLAGWLSARLKVEATIAPASGKRRPGGSKSPDGAGPRRDSPGSPGTGHGAASRTGHGSADGTGHGAADGTGRGSADGTGRGAADGTGHGSADGTGHGAASGTGRGSADDAGRAGGSAGGDLGSPGGAGALSGVAIGLADGTGLSLTRRDGRVLLKRTGEGDRVLPLVPRRLGDELAEELRRLDADQPYAAALAAATGATDLDERSPTRVHIWHDPTLAERPEATP